MADDNQNQNDAAASPEQIDSLLADVPVQLTVELGRATLSLKDLSARLGPGSVITLSKLTGEKLDIRVNDHLVARGEAVAVGDRYGVRVVEIANGGKP